MPHEVRVPIGAHELVIETGRMAKLNNGSCVVSYGDTMVLVALADGPPRKNLGFFPLTMDFREKMYATGSIPGGFFKREGRPSEKEVLTMRMMDRPIRPLWPEGFLWDLQVQAWVLSSDAEIDGDILAINGASTALCLSNLPFQGPVGAVRVGRVDDEWVFNPTNSQREESLVDLVVVGTKKAITMVECSAKELPEDLMVEAFELAHEKIVEICEAQDELAKVAGKEKMEVEPVPEDAKLRAKIRRKHKKTLQKAHREGGNKHERMAIVKTATKAVIAEYAPEDENGNVDEALHALVKRYVKELSKDVFREICLSGERYDGRKPDEIRALSCDVDVLPRTHGSALFERGETQALVVATLGTKMDEQLIEGLHDTYKRKFMLHYDFPNFCVGEPRPIRGTSRREVGHGKLGERAIAAVLPDHEDFPYTIRIVSETLSSNGSSSMASVCGATLALMDAGVKISQPVAGIAMGMVKEGDQEVVLTDIAGSEDSWGDMDFKVAGTQRGITALQMDIKIEGVSSDLMRRALNQGRDARIEILRAMLTTIRRPREKLNPNAPRLEKFPIPKDKIGAVIGPGGKVIRKLEEQFKLKVAVEDDGFVTLYADNGKNIDACRETIDMLTGNLEVGTDYEGTVVSVKEFGAFVELVPGVEGMCHVSELADEYVDSPEDVIAVGDTVKMRVVHVDNSGKIKLSRKAVIREEKGLPEEPYTPPSRGGGRGGGRRGGGGGGRGRGRRN